MIRRTSFKTGLRTTFETRTDPKDRAEDLRSLFAELRKSATISPLDRYEASGPADFGKDKEFYLIPGVFSPFREYMADPTNPRTGPSGAAGGGSGFTRPSWYHRIQIDGSQFKPPSTPGFILPTLAPRPGSSDDPNGLYGALQLSNFDLACECWDKEEDAAIMGWGGEDYGNAGVASTAVAASSAPPAISKTPGGTGDGSVQFNNCNLDAGKTCDWGVVYSWFPGNKYVAIYNGTLRFCRFGVSMVSSGSDGTQTTIIRGVQAFGDANGSKSFGATSKMDEQKGGHLTLLLQRGGSATIEDNYVRAIGLSAEYDPRIIAANTGGPPLDPNNDYWSVRRVAALVSDAFYSSPAAGAVYNVYGNKTEVTQGPVATWSGDIDISSPTAILNLNRKLGCGQQGDFKIRLHGKDVNVKI